MIFLLGSFAGFRFASEGLGARTGGWGKHTRIGGMYSGYSKKSSLQKFSDFVFLNLHHAREARGLPISPYAALRAARSEIAERGLPLILESLLYSVRTYFAQRPD